MTKMADFVYAAMEMLGPEWERCHGRGLLDVRHRRCGSVVTVQLPSHESAVAMSGAAAVAALDDAVSMVQCSCVPGPPEGWDPDDDLPATRGDIKALLKEIRRIGARR